MSGHQGLEVAEPFLAVELGHDIAGLDLVALFRLEVGECSGDVLFHRAGVADPGPLLGLDVDFVVGRVGRRALQLHRAVVDDLDHVHLCVGDTYVVQAAEPFLTVKLGVVVERLDLHGVVAQGSLQHLEQLDRIACLDGQTHPVPAFGQLERLGESRLLKRGEGHHVAPCFWI